LLKFVEQNQEKKVKPISLRERISWIRIKYNPIIYFMSAALEELRKLNGKQKKLTMILEIVEIERHAQSTVLII
jgi:hypothetical protein